MNYCLNCGQKLPFADPHFCPFCGIDLSPYWSATHKKIVAYPKVSSTKIDTDLVHSKMSKAKRPAEASSSNLGEEVKNLKENLVNSETQKSNENTKIIQPKKADIIQKPTLNKENKVSSDTNDVITTPDPELPAPASSSTNNKDTETQEDTSNNQVIINPEEISNSEEPYIANTKLNNEKKPSSSTSIEISPNIPFVKDTEVKDKEETSVSNYLPDEDNNMTVNSEKVTNSASHSSTEETTPSSLEEYKSKAIETIIEDKPNDELPNTLQNTIDLGSKYAQVAPAKHLKVDKTASEDDVNSASTLLSNLALHKHTNNIDSEIDDNRDTNVSMTSKRGTHNVKNITSATSEIDDELPTESPTELPAKYAQEESENVVKVTPVEDTIDLPTKEVETKHLNPSLKKKQHKELRPSMFPH